MAVLFIFYAVIVLSKQKSMVIAHKGLDNIRWDNLSWTPPKLVLSNFRKQGKICKDLTNIEAAFYLGLPLKRIFSGMLASMESEGFLAIESKDPLRVRTIKTPDSNQLDDYERLFYGCLSDDGAFSQYELEHLMNTAIRSIQAKAWDADINATKKYYIDRMQAAIDADGKGEKRKNSDKDWYNWYHNFPSPLEDGFLISPIREVR